MVGAGAHSFISACALLKGFLFPHKVQLCLNCCHSFSFGHMNDLSEESRGLLRAWQLLPAHC